MTEFVSQTKVVPATQEAVFNKLSDWSQLESLSSMLPQDKVSDVHSDSDSVRFKPNLPGVGEMAVRIIEREPCKTIKIASEQSPVSFTAWLQLKEKDATSSYARITVRAEIPFLLKGMITKPLQEAIDKMADALASGNIPF